MSRIPATLCTGVVVALAALASAQGQAVVAAKVASAWAELASARVRLIAGPAAAKPAKAYLAGIEIVLADGWKTYWRMPGDAGVPPTFDWTGSTNVAAIAVRYPAPSRLHEPAAETIGYLHAAIFPVEVTPQDAKKPVDLMLMLEFGICREICIPAQLTMSLVIPPQTLAGAPASDILAALARVPRPQASRQPNDPQLKRATASLEGTAPKLLIEARFPRGDKGADLFLEGPDGLYVPLPKRLPDAADGTARFEVDLARGGNAGELRGKSLTLTLVSDAGASEAVWTVP